MQNNHAIQLVLFDIDGTLLWPKGCGRAAASRAMQDVFGTTGTIETCHFGGKTDWAILSEALALAGYTVDDIGRRMPAYEKAMARYLSQIIGDYAVEACPGALDVARYFHDHETIVSGIVTGNVSSTAPIKLRAAGFEPEWFAISACGNEAAERDALPELALERAIRHAGRLITPEQVLVVGDTPADVACARAVGAMAVAVTTGFATQEELTAAKPDYLLDDLSELVEILRNTDLSK
jgi:phosphoglycolate phosphatase